MKRWEYHILTLDLKGGRASGMVELNAMGKNGWCVISSTTIGDSTGMILLLKREVIP